MKACVIIPTYNEAREIGRLVQEIKEQNLDVVVIDDGSGDNTSTIAENSGAVVLRSQKNLGKGASLIKGFSYALEKDFDAVITIDGDGQHLTEDIPYFIRHAMYSNSQVFVGNRMFKTNNMPFVRVLTNKIMSWIISIVAKQRVPDSQCGFRLIKREALQRINLKTSKYETESELIIKSSRQGFRIESVPIKTIYANERSQINPFIDTVRFFRYLIREMMR